MDGKNTKGGKSHDTWQKSGTLIKKETNQSLKDCLWSPGVAVNFEEIKGALTMIAETNQVFRKLSQKIQGSLKNV